jgi:putative tricarboxylic transport membrane protein
MESLFDHLYFGFSISLGLTNILFCFIGVCIGTLIGVLPGIGPVATVSILIPSTYHLSPVAAIIMLAGIYYGAQYGASTTSILLNIPGEASSVVTCLDGYQMARQGRAGPALGIAALGSFIAGTMATFGLAMFAPPLATIALKLGAPEYTTLIFMGLAMAIFLGQKSMLKALAMVVLGLALATVGRETVTGFARFTFGVYRLDDGLDFLPLIMGLFGISEVLINVEKELTSGTLLVKEKITGLLPSLHDWGRSILPILRGSVIGFFLGILPGGGAMLASFTSYIMEKKISREPEKFGTGVIEGVAGPESANNAGSQGSFIPLLTLGIPSNAVMAILMGALMIHGVQPGPLTITKNPDLFWGTITSMYIGNVMLVLLNLPLIGIWVKILKVPYGILFPLVLLFVIIGAFSLNNSVFEVYLTIFFGGLGYIMRKVGYEPAPLVLSFVLGPMFEDALRQSLVISHGDLTVFINRPLSLGFLVIGLTLLLLPLVPQLQHWVQKVRETTEEKD